MNFKRWFNDNFDWFIPSVVGFCILVFVVCPGIFLPKCSHPFVSCVDCDLYNRSSGEWHIHKARCRECGKDIGFFTTDEMVDWNS